MVYVPATARTSGYWVASAADEQPCIRRGLTALDPADNRRLRKGIEFAFKVGSTRAIGELIVHITDQGLSLFEALAELDALQLLGPDILRHFGGCEWPATPVDPVPA